MNKIYLTFTLIMVILSLFTFYTKGYLNVSGFISNDSSVESYLNSSFKDSFAFGSLDSSVIETSLKKNFPEIKTVTFEPRLGLKYFVYIEEYVPFAYNEKSNQYISTDGYVFSTNKKYSNNLPKYHQVFKVGTVVLTIEEINFMQKIPEYPNIDFSTSDENSILVSSSENPTILIDRNTKSLLSMVIPVTKMLDKISNNKVHASRIIVLEDKLVLKK